MPYSDDLIKNSHDTREDEDDEDDNDRLDVVGLDENPPSPSPGMLT